MNNCSIDGCEKQCVKCLSILPFESFKKNKRRKNGIESYCKKCHVKNTLISRKKHKIENKKIDEYAIKKCKKHGNLEYSNIGLIIYNSCNPIVVDMTCLICKNENQLKKYNNNNVIQNISSGFLECYVCLNKKHLSHFYKSELKRKSHACSSCIQQKQKIYKERSSIKRKYKITLQQYDEILKLQNHVCKICNNKEIRKHRLTNQATRLAVDHCHITGKIRGLLCSNCNLMIGNARDSIDILKSGIKYLECKGIENLSTSGNK